MRYFRTVKLFCAKFKLSGIFFFFASYVVSSYRDGLKKVHSVSFKIAIKHGVSFIDHQVRQIREE